MQQAVDVFEAFISQSKPTPIPLNLGPAQFGEVFVCNPTIPGLNLIQQLKGRRIMRVTGGSTYTYVFEQSSDIQNTITALNTGQDDRIYSDDRVTGTIEDAISCLEGTKIIDISAGKSHVVILTHQGEVYTYGYGQHGVLGHGGSYFQQKPRIVRKLENRVINKIACGMFHTLALSNYGDVYAWGKGFEGQLGIRKDLECCSSPQLIVGFYKYDQGEIGYMKKTVVKDIGCGANHSMAIDEHGSLYCWGEARFGQTGNGRKVKQPLPQLVQIKSEQNQSRKVKKASGGYGHTLCLTQDGFLYSWGLNVKGQIGINDISQNTKVSIYDNQLKNVKAVHYPQLLSSDNSKALLPKFVEIACGFNSSFAIDVNGQPWGWGGDTNGFKDQGYCERAPRRITQNTEDRIFNRVFANQDTVVCFAPVRMLSFNPILGPSKGNTELTLFGTGFVETGSQKIKFSIGEEEIIIDCEFDASSLTYFCKTPNFQEIASNFPVKCRISLSLDGQQFYPFNQQFLLYSSELTADSIQPKSASSKGDQPLTLSIELPSIICEYIPSITIGFKLFNKDQKEEDDKPSWTCVEGIYKEREIQCTIPRIQNFENAFPYYHVDISINGQQFSGYPNTIRLYELNNIDVSPKEGYQQGNYPITIAGQGLFDSTRKKIELRVILPQNYPEQLELKREIEVISWDKQLKKYSFEMPALTWLLSGNQPTPELIEAVKNGIIQIKLTLSGTEWIPIGQFKFVAPPPPPPEPQEEKDTKKGAKKAAKK